MRNALLQTKAALGLLDRFKDKTHIARSAAVLGAPSSFGPDFVRAAYLQKRQALDPAEPALAADLAADSDRTKDSSAAVSFAELTFPQILIMDNNDINPTCDDDGCKSFMRQQTLRLENSRSQSAATLAEGPHALKSRVRRSRLHACRRNSFSNGVAARRKVVEAEQRGPCGASSPSRRQLFLHSLSSRGMDTAEKWPERICRLLTNDQSLPARLKMFQYFSSVLSTLKQRNDAALPAEIVPSVSALRLESGAWSICKPGKPNGGEDAYFAGLDSFAGVADGVGEWGDYGCCPRQFAYSLMDGSYEQARKLPFHCWADNGAPAGAELKASERALAVLRSGFVKAKGVKSCFGSSTALIAGLDRLGERLGIACLGDSSCIVLRRSPLEFKNRTITKRTREQQHFFNCPYQLSRLPDPEDLPDLEQRGLYRLIRVLANMSTEMTGDSPEQADLVDIKVKEGDLVILGTDGLFDNLFDHEIISLASLALSPYEARLFFDREADESGLRRSESCPLTYARRLTADWVRRRAAHPMALDPPSLLSASYRGGAGCGPLVRADSVSVAGGSIATPADLVARAVAEAAFYRSIDSRAKSPFAKAARAAGGAASGGKEDDITVVACWVVAS